MTKELTEKEILRRQKISKKLKNNESVKLRLQELAKTKGKFPRKEDTTMCTVPECNKPNISATSKNQRSSLCQSCRDLHADFKIYTPDRDKLIKKQNNKCKICNNIFDKAPHVDHCHTTGKIRGMLCKNCNLGIGNLQDSVDVLQNAINYLNQS